MEPIGHFGFTSPFYVGPTGVPYTGGTATSFGSSTSVLTSSAHATISETDWHVAQDVTLYRAAVGPPARVELPPIPSGAFFPEVFVAAAACLLLYVSGRGRWGPVRWPRGP